MLKVKAVLVLYIITSSFCVHYAEVDHLCLAKMAEEIVYIEGFEYSLVSSPGSVTLLGLGTRLGYNHSFPDANKLLLYLNSHGTPIVGSAN